MNKIRQGRMKTITHDAHAKIIEVYDGLAVDLGRCDKDEENGNKIRVPEEFGKKVGDLGPPTGASAGENAADEVPVKFGVGEVVGDDHAKGHVVEDLCDLKGVSESGGLVPKGHHDGACRMRGGRGGPTWRLVSFSKAGVLILGSHTARHVRLLLSAPPPVDFSDAASFLGHGFPFRALQ